MWPAGVNDAPARVVETFAPARLAFAGGGTDLPAFAERYGGAVLSVTLSLGARVRATALSPPKVILELDDFNFRREYSSVAEMNAQREKNAELVAAAVAEVLPGGGAAARVRTGIPPGSGLGTSGAVGVATVAALCRLAGKELSAEEIAELASVIEIEKVNRPVGRQDQYAAACGGLNLFHFTRAGVLREPVDVSDDNWRALQSHFMLFFSGKRRDAAEVLTGQRTRLTAGDAQTIRALSELKELALAMADALRKFDLPAFGAMMHAGWEAKRRVAANVADEKTARLVAEVRALGAWAMKVMGAGAGGFYAVMGPPAKHAAIASFLATAGFERYDFQFTREGLKVTGQM